VVARTAVARIETGTSMARDLVPELSGREDNIVTVGADVKKVLTIGADAGTVTVTGPASD
jgi:hypothetical protein